MIKASIIGAMGYTGLELIRLLVAHPHVEIAYLTSRQHDDVALGELYPHLANLDLRVTNTAPEEVAASSDIVFLALPHRAAQETVAALHGKVKIVDLSADFRLDDAATYERYYNTPHNYPALLDEVVYGLPEITGAKAIAAASTVANPGCFALLSQMLLHPFKGAIKSADIFAVTGSSGAGKSATDGTHHPVRNHNIKSYNINKHRHIPEIIRAGGITEDQLNFVPSSGPFTRGIFAQAFITLDKDVDFSGAYKGTPFVRIGDSVALANVVGSNYVDLSFMRGQDNRILAQGAIDNLVKGAAGCAVQNMNIMFGMDETTGLNIITPLYP